MEFMVTLRVHLSNMSIVLIGLHSECHAFAKICPMLERCLLSMVKKIAEFICSYRKALTMNVPPASPRKFGSDRTRQVPIFIFFWVEDPPIVKLSKQTRLSRPKTNHIMIKRVNKTKNRLIWFLKVHI